MFAERPTQLPSELVLGKLKPLLEDPAVLKIGHNIKFDWVVLNRRGIGVAPYDDTMVMSFDLDAGGSTATRSTIWRKKHLDHECIAFKDVCGTGKKQIGFNRVPARPRHRICRRGCRRDAAAVAAAQAAAAVETATRVYELVDRPMVAVIGRMERDGIKVDREELKRLSAEFNAADRRAREADPPRLAAASPSAAPAIGRHPVRPDGPVGRSQGQVRRLFDRRHRARAAAAEGVPIARLVLDWRQLTKLKSTYTDALQAADQPGDGPRPHLLLAVGRADRPARLDRSRTSRTSRSAPKSAAGSATPSSPSRACGPLRRLQPDRAAARRAYGRRPATEGSLRPAARHP